MKKFFALVLILLTPSLSLANDYREGEALAVFRTDVSVSAAVEEVEASIAESYETLSEIEGKVIVLVRSSTKTTEQLIAELKARPDVITASPNYYSRPISIKSSAIIPNDPSVDLCWGLSAINAPEVWERTTGNGTVHVGIVDTGLYRHPDLEANIEPALGMNTTTVNGDYDLNFTSWDADLDGHGTHVAGTIGAVGNNNIGVAGVNWNVGLFALRVFDTDNAFETISNEMRALNYVADLIRKNPDLRIAALNFSLGAALPITPTEMKDNVYYMAYHAVDSLNTTLIVAAAGNDGLALGEPAPFDDTRGSNKFKKGSYHYPASFIGLKNLITVGSVASDDTASYFSNWGDNVDVAAPGSGIFSTYSPIAKEDPDLYSYSSGTSMAAPHVTGAVALLASAYPEANAAQIKESILESANRDKNPIVYPFAYPVEEYVKTRTDEIDEMILEGFAPIESRDAMIAQARHYAEGRYGPYKQLDGQGRVSRTGMLDVKAAYEALGRKVRGGGSSSGCNAGFMIAGLVILGGLFYRYARHLPL